DFSHIQSRQSPPHVQSGSENCITFAPAAIATATFFGEACPGRHPNCKTDILLSSFSGDIAGGLLPDASRRFGPALGASSGARPLYAAHQREHMPIGPRCIARA